MMNKIEELMLKKQQEREEKAKSGFFANKTVCHPEKETPMKSERVCSGPKRKITIRHYVGYQNTFYFMLDQFEAFKGILYDENPIESVVTETKEKLLGLYKNKVNFAARTISMHDDDEIWVILERKFRRDYYKLYKAKYH